ncbi:MAG: hypothetical protein Harvfovirus7_18 [Harvfovirus sp.]|uniref:Uncharacterized protein n=1 Tax=Harvfovirus sp. TaxID=2487768 RepID=A0A3G5A3P6_9VIRU|nr:MAG: hypothetical protein Harvfovirus7_18 [Harvfovirus sp.]
MNHPGSLYKFDPKDCYSIWLSEAIHHNVPEDSFLIFLQLLWEKTEHVLDINGLLIEAAWMGTDAEIKKLISMGANIETVSTGMMTPLMLLAERDLLETFDYMISIGANFHAKTKTDHDVEYFAKTEESLKIIKRIEELKKLYSGKAEEIMREREEILEKNKELTDTVSSLMNQLQEMERKLNGDFKVAI